MDAGLLCDRNFRLPRSILQARGFFRKVKFPRSEVSVNSPATIYFKLPVASDDPKWRLWRLHQPSSNLDPFLLSFCNYSMGDENAFSLICFPSHSRASVPGSRFRIRVASQATSLQLPVISLVNLMPLYMMSWMLKSLGPEMLWLSDRHSRLIDESWRIRRLHYWLLRT
jgi:hypothetical protein